MKENNKSLVTGIVVVSVVVVGYLVWASYANKKVREVVDNSLQRIEERMEAKGNEVTITYDDVNVHSFSLRPRASVYKLHMKIDDKRRGREMHLMMPEVVYTPKTFNMKSYKLEVLDSISMMATRPGKEQESTLIDFSSVPALNVSERSNGDMFYSMDVPEHITLTEVEEGSDAASADKTDIIFASRPSVEWGINKNGISLNQKAVFPEITVTHAGEELAKAAGLSAETIHTPVDGNIHSYDMLMKLDNLVFAAPELAVLNPITVVNDISYTGPIAPANSTEPLKEAQHFKVKNIAWMSGLLSLFANGEMHLDPEQERLPYGKISLRFDDVDKFLEYAGEQRPAAKEYLMEIRNALEQLSGAEMEDGTVSIHVQREQNGRLYIGELSLEESFALFIQMAMQLPDLSAPAQPVMPAEDAGDMQEGDDAAEEEASSEDDSIVEGDEVTEDTTEELVEDDVTEEAAPQAEGAETTSENDDAADISDVMSVDEDDVVEESQAVEDDVQIEIRTNNEDVSVDVIEPADSDSAQEEQDAEMAE